MLPLVISIVLIVSLLIFFFYAGLTVRQTARFRYLSKRTVYLTILFTSLSAVLLTIALVLYGMILL